MPEGTTKELIEQLREQEWIDEEERANTAASIARQIEGGYRRAKKRINRFHEWQEFKTKLVAKGIDYANDEHLNPAVSRREILFYRYLTSDEELADASLYVDDSRFFGFDDFHELDTFLEEYREALREGGRLGEIEAVEEPEKTAKDSISWTNWIFFAFIIYVLYGILTGQL